MNKSIYGRHGSHGIFEDLLRIREEEKMNPKLSTRKLKRALRYYCRCDKYIAVCNPGATRVDLEGLPSGELSEKEAKFIKEEQSTRRLFGGATTTPKRKRIPPPVKKPPMPKKKKKCKKITTAQKKKVVEKKRIGNLAKLLTNK